MAPPSAQRCARRRGLGRQIGPGRACRLHGRRGDHCCPKPDRPRDLYDHRRAPLTLWGTIPGRIAAAWSRTEVTMVHTEALHRTIVVVDIAGYTRLTRTAAHQAAAHDGLRAILGAAFAAA